VTDRAKKAERLGSVTAKDEIEAVRRAFKDYDIAEKERWRISVQREAYGSVARRGRPKRARVAMAGLERSRNKDDQHQGSQDG
jgi:hypothetical protein